MINIVHGNFRTAAPSVNTVFSRNRALAASIAFIAAMGSDTSASETFETIAHRCAGVICEERPNARRPPGAPDRDARPFGGSLGRPCAYRLRYEPSGVRRVRVCF